MTVRRFATYFDSHYLPRALALGASLQRHAQAQPFELHALCLDDAGARAVAALGHPWKAHRLQDLEVARPQLQGPRRERSRIEYYFTLGPTWLDWLLSQNPSFEDITYLDADLYFFSPWEALYRELGGAQVGLVEHRFPAGLESQAKTFGRYNVAWMYFKSQGAGRDCLRWWAQACLDWCYDRVEEGRFADQKYLDEFEEHFEGVKVLGLRGANVAPWNLKGARVTRGPEGPLINGEPVIFYHFHGLKPLGGGWVDCNLAEYGLGLNRALRKGLYMPYIYELAGLGDVALSGGIRAKKGDLRLKTFLGKVWRRQLLWVGKAFG